MTAAEIRAAAYALPVGDLDRRAGLCAAAALAEARTPNAARRMLRGADMDPQVRVRALELITQEETDA